jgi:aspartate/methionine/tyrosine aminotransferase
LQAIALTCRQLGVRLISDEIYHWLDYETASVSALEFSPDAVIINSFSKYYCMTGWRVGWMVVPEDMRRKVHILQQNLFIAAPTPSQIGAIVALGERDYADALKHGYARNRALLASGLESLGFGVGHPSDGAFYLYADVSRFTGDSLDFCRRLLGEAGVSTTPGLDFDRTDGHRFMRFSYAGSHETVEQALERIGKWLARGP